MSNYIPKQQIRLSLSACFENARPTSMMVQGYEVSQNFNSTKLEGKRKNWALVDKETGYVLYKKIPTRELAQKLAHKMESLLEEHHCAEDSERRKRFYSQWRNLYKIDALAIELF